MVFRFGQFLGWDYRCLRFYRVRSGIRRCSLQYLDSGGIRSRMAHPIGGELFPTIHFDVAVRAFYRSTDLPLRGYSKELAHPQAAKN